jgi:hypothetical protein
MGHKLDFYELEYDPVAGSQGRGNVADQPKQFELPMV